LERKDKNQRFAFLYLPNTPEAGFMVAGMTIHFSGFGMLPFR
jgi:hypothetical protein